MEERGSDSGTVSGHARRSLVFIGLVALALLIWQVASALVLVFVGVILAVFLRGLALRLSERIDVRYGWALAIVVIVLAGLVVGSGWMLGPRIVDQTGEIMETIPESIDQLAERVQQSPLGGYLQEGGGSAGGMSQIGSGVFSQLTGIASMALSSLMDIVLVLFIALFFAIDADLYKRGILLLVPEKKAHRLKEALDASGEALWKWLMARLLAMLFVGIVVTVGLSLLGIPLALTLGLIAALFDFVPFIGPIVAAVPGVLLGLTEGPTQAVYAALVYLGAQQLEGNLITPLVQQKVTSIPPVLELFAVIAGGMLLGIIGMLVATPFAVIIMVMVTMLYVQDVLGKDVSVPGHHQG